METTLEQAITTAQKYASYNGDKFGDFGTVTEGSFTKRDSDGTPQFHVVMFTKGQLIMSSDTDLPPLLHMSHSRDGDWTENDEPSRMLTNTVSQSHRLMGIGKYAGKGALRADPARFEMASRARAEWGLPTLASVGDGSDESESQLDPPSAPTDSHPQIFPVSDLMSGPHVVPGWEHIALDAMSYETDYSDWAQGYPSNVLKFNQLIPGHQAVGCIAVAACQLQAAHKWPRKVQSYVHPWGKYNGVSYEATGMNYDEWWRINPAWTANNTVSPKYLMSDAMYGHISYNTGVYCSMSYEGDGAYTWTMCQTRALRQFLGYPHAKTIRGYSPYVTAGMTEEDGFDAGYTGNHLPNILYKDMGRLIYDQIRADLPVLMSIYTSSGSGGHAVIATGIGTVKTTIDHDTQYAGRPVVFVDVGWGGLTRDTSGGPAYKGGSGWYPLPYIYTKATSGSSTSMYGVVDTITVQTVPDGGTGATRSVVLRGSITDSSGESGTVKVRAFNAGGCVLNETTPDSNGAFLMLIDPTVCEGTCQIEVDKYVSRGSYADVYVKKTQFEVGVTVRDMSGTYPNDCVGDPDPRTHATNGDGIPIEENTYVADLPHPVPTVADFDGVFTIDITAPTEMRKVPITQSGSSSGT